MITGESDTVVIALAVLAFMGTVVTTITTSVVAIYTHKANTLSRQTHDLVNGASEKIIKLEKAVSYGEGAAGHAAGLQMERGFDNDPTLTAKVIDSGEKDAGSTG